ncbi:ABC transporter ATP-binding protein [Candidatus Neoehrlichia procyonis]|uniref:ABC transporter family protein n=1 Tax=Candidatus Neoehrlichia procyonis str. RAC413 TaxID=1359163 RepID=A0A0F3NP30_9RICK|nr:ABC transporter ATP-binding protein [Candidatus Neoehrlichia lotoris]KJV68649.1 ABC transporter family protein [Candidatus Neoehrlichia lotoris str. RAC413]
MVGLQLSDVSHRYRKSKFLLDNINISCKKGDVICLLGPSGCGKSTILRLISGLEKLQSGSICINNKVIANEKVFVPTENRNIGLIFQHPSLFPHQTVIENVMFAIRDVSGSQKVSIALEMLASINMEHYKDVYPHMLSGGQQQLITIIRAIAQQPDIMLFDEPFSNLDTMLKLKIRKHILLILKQHNITVVLVTHDPEEALEVADKIYVMSDGYIVQSGTASEVYYNPKNHILAQFFGEVNCFYSKVVNKSVHLSIGKIPTTFNEGDNVMVCIRPEAIIPQQYGVGVKVIVKFVKFFCNMLCVGSKDNLYWMRFSGAVLPKIGDNIFVSLNIDQVLLFKL